jgi:hypothetical protein
VTVNAEWKEVVEEVAVVEEDMIENRDGILAEGTEGESAAGEIVDMAVDAMGRKTQHAK